MKLLPREYLVKTSDVDHADWNYRPVLGVLQRLRFKNAIRLLEKTHHKRLLEIGYGSGIFLPQLKEYCDQIYGIDIHDKHNEVAKSLKQYGIISNLQNSSVTNLPFESDYFDCVVAISTIEYVEDIQLACSEVKRVLIPGGKFIVITPGHSVVLDMGLQLLTGEKAENNYGQRRQRLIPALSENFVIEEKIITPIIIGSIIPLYTSFRLTN